MSSLASVHRGGASGTIRTPLSLSSLRMPLGADQAAGVALAVVLTLFAFLTAGGVELANNTWAEIALLLVGVGAATAVLVYGGRAPWWGGVTLGLFCAVTALSAISIAWSVQPDNSWFESGRAVSYLGAFTAAIAAARLFGQRIGSLLGAIAMTAAALSGYALLVKVFPGTLDQADPVARVKAPFDYWNAVGLIAAMGFPPCLWAGSRRSAGAHLRALCVPAIAVMVTALLLSYSRSALFGAVAAVVVWFAVCDTRLRAALILGLGALGGGAATVWALGTHPLTRDGASLAARSAAGHAFGLLLLGVLGLLLASGYAAGYAMDRVRLDPGHRRSLGTALIVCLALVPAAGIGALVASKRGPIGEVTHVWHSLTNSSQVTGDVPGRLVELANSRPRYWHEGILVGEHALFKGVGAGGYGTARPRHTNDPWIVQHAHSYVVETFADFGLIGLILNLALLLAWALASARTLGLARFSRRAAVHSAEAATPAPQRGERAATLTLLCIVIAFGISSAVDWTWFVPGAAIPALLAAGWLAGRGPLERRAGVHRVRVALTERPSLLAALALSAAVTLLLAWAIWQPLRSADADSAAVAALARGDARAALTDASAAAARDPVAVEPLWELSAIYSAIGNDARARAELVSATRTQPANPDTWRQLGFYELQHRRPEGALADLRRALSLDPASSATIEWIKQAQSESRVAS